MHWGRTRATPWLLEHGANPNSLHPKVGLSALHSAVKQGKSDAVIRLLLKHGADPRVKTADGQTAIQLARKSRKARILKLLEQVKAKPRRRKSTGTKARK
jgi:ankyrin repeat protein